MNRPIKYQAWDGKKMYEVASLILHTHSLQAVVWVSDTQTKTLSNPKVRQFTGLLDKNGVEVFEGDIVRDYHGEQGPVEFAKWVSDNDNGDDVLTWGYHASLRFIPLDPQTTSSAVEVIGNIHEHGHLLPEDK